MSGVKLSISLTPAFVCAKNDNQSSERPLRVILEEEIGGQIPQLLVEHVIGWFLAVDLDGQHHEQSGREHPHRAAPTGRTNACVMARAKCTLLRSQTTDLSEIANYTRICVVVRVLFGFFA